MSSFAKEFDQVTESVKLVSMPRWSYRRVCEVFAGLSLADDLTDARAAKQHRIVAAATDLFLRHGFRKTSVEEIARAAGVAKGTVYLYFQTKAEILVQAIVEEKRHFVKQIEPVFAAPPSERLRRWLEIALVLVGEMPLTSRLLAGDGDVVEVLSQIDGEVRTGSESLQIDFLSELIDLAAAPHRWTDQELADRAVILLNLLLGAGVYMDPRVRHGMSVERYAGVLADMLVHGVTCKEANQTAKPDRPSRSAMEGVDDDHTK